MRVRVFVYILFVPIIPEEVIYRRFGLKPWPIMLEATAIFIKVLETLTSQGFQVLRLSGNENPVVAVKFAANENPILCFSKTYDHPFNPSTQFGAVMTCSNADEGCPIVVGSEARFPIKYDDPKAYDGTPLQTEKYAEKSLDIAREMWWVFSQIK
jgi:arsenate reductase